QACADSVDTDDRTVLLTDDLDESGGVQDDGLAVAAEVVLERLDLLLAVLLFGLRGRETDGEDLRLAVGDAGNARFEHRGRVQSGDLLSHEDSLSEGAVGQLQAGNDVAAGVDVADAGVQTLIGEDESAIH